MENFLSAANVNNCFQDSHVTQISTAEHILMIKFENSVESTQGAVLDDAFSDFTWHGKLLYLFPAFLVSSCDRSSHNNRNTFAGRDTKTTATSLCTCQRSTQQ
uniref:Uncharacterized protein n=1 Tax=Tetraselmis sp. GSL018 TaxID=582737 RepID=A0A061QW58_9CHLO